MSAGNREVRSEGGVTLLELMIAITLVAGLSTGMLMAMRTSLLTYEKTAKRLESNRRFVKTQQMLSDQISAVMPVQGACLGGDGLIVGIPSFLSGSEDSLRMVSSYSIAEGSAVGQLAPQLFMQLVADPTSGANGLAIWWANGTMQSTTNLAAPNWQNVPTTNGQTSIRINPALPCQFFRVVQP